MQLALHSTGQQRPQPQRRPQRRGLPARSEPEGLSRLSLRCPRWQPRYRRQQWSGRADALLLGVACERCQLVEQCLQVVSLLQAQTVSPNDRPSQLPVAGAKFSSKKSVANWKVSMSRGLERRANKDDYRIKPIDSLTNSRSTSAVQPEAASKTKVIKVCSTLPPIQCL